MTPQPRHPAAARPGRRTLIVAAAATALVAAGTVPAALAGQRGSAASQRPAPAADQNLALGRPVTGSAPCRADEGLAKAVDGAAAGLRDKWCSAAGAKTLRIDLGAATALTSIVVKHAAAGGEKAAYNTRDFDLAVSTDGTTFSTVATVRGNTTATTSHLITATARFVRLTVLAGDQAGTGPARIYELEAYGAAAPSPTPSASVPAPPSPSPSNPAPPPPPPSPPAPPVPPPTGSCFPYPAHDPAQGPHPQVIQNPGVPPFSAKYLDPAKTMWIDQWPGTWQTFATAGALRDPHAGVSKAIFTTDTHAAFGDATIEMPYKDYMDAIDRGDPGMWMHESAHLLQTDYPYPSPKLFGEGVPDFVRFVAHGEDPAWKIVSLSATDSSFFDEQKAWDSGYKQAARFFLWLTQHYDKSGARYQLLHDFLCVGVNPDWQGLFVKATGKSYHQLFTEYAADRTINPHC